MPGFAPPPSRENRRRRRQSDERMEHAARSHTDRNAHSAPSDRGVVRLVSFREPLHWLTIKAKWLREEWPEIDRRAKARAFMLALFAQERRSPEPEPPDTSEDRE